MMYSPSMYRILSYRSCIACGLGLGEKNIEGKWSPEIVVTVGTVMGMIVWYNTKVNKNDV